MRWETLLLLLGAVVIPLGCLLPMRWLPTLPNDKLLHFLAFGAMALAAGRLAGSGAGLLGALAAVLVLSWVIECLQTHVPGRHFCWRDMAANAAGVLCAGLAVLLLPP